MSIALWSFFHPHLNRPSYLDSPELRRDERWRVQIHAGKHRSLLRWVVAGGQPQVVAEAELLAEFGVRGPGLFHFLVEIEEGFARFGDRDRRAIRREAEHGRLNRIRAGCL